MGAARRPAPIIASRVTSSASAASVEPLAAGGAHRHHQVAQLGGRVPDPDAGRVGQGHAELGQHPARVDDGARAVGRRLVPDRRQAEHAPGIAGAQGADDEVVLGGGVEHRAHVLALPPAVAERGDGGGGVAAAASRRSRGRSRPAPPPAPRSSARCGARRARRSRRARRGPPALSRSGGLERHDPGGHRVELAAVPGLFDGARSRRRAASRQSRGARRDCSLGASDQYIRGSQTLRQRLNRTHDPLSDTPEDDDPDGTPTPRRPIPARRSPSRRRCAPPISTTR